jgi:hypothetical protein
MGYYAIEVLKKKKEKKGKKKKEKVLANKVQLE